VVVEGVRVAVFRVGDDWFALKDACPHMGASLADGLLHGGRVICHWHQWTFNLKSGEGENPRRGCAAVYDVRIDGDEVWLRPPPPPSAPPEEDDDWMRQDPETWFKKN
jgi:nitrite reductase (NADH) small subunit/3-phenylpropionate/trans-cinnamate dioxygenase ferredoxin subunit